MNHRFDKLLSWVQKEFNYFNITLIPIPGDASFREYFRVKNNNNSFIVMDASLELENNISFVAIAQEFMKRRIKVPIIYSVNLSDGFLLMEDFGNRILLNELNKLTADHFYHKAMESLLKIANCKEVPNYHIPIFDSNEIKKELFGFETWFLEKYIQIDNFPLNVLNSTFNLLIESAEKQPQVCIHRDYHSRNLMVLNDDSIGVLDFQDASFGPLTYDLVSLLRDCYITWPRKKVINWALNFSRKLKEQKLLFKCSDEQFIKWFDLMGIQRHLKALFIFARKYLRDNSKLFLKYIPRTLNYILTISKYYKEFSFFNKKLNDVVLPKLVNI